jgi:hypothetical protein
MRKKHRQCGETLQIGKYLLFLDRENTCHFHASFEKENLRGSTFCALSIPFIQKEEIFYKKGMFSFVILI